MLTNEKLQKINSMITTTNIKGKEYAPVSERVRAFREVLPDWRIITTIVSFQDSEWVIKAEIQDQDGDTQATGYASEKVGAGNINRTSALENAETSAVGRALGFLGVGIAASIASADEVTNAAAQLAEIQMREALATAAEKRTLNDLCKKLGQDPLQIARQAGWTSGPLTVEQHGKAMIILSDIEQSTEWMRNE